MIERIIVHHTAGGKYETLESIRKFHLFRGWSDIGYHYVVGRDGQLHLGRPIIKSDGTFRPGAHCRGYNETSIGIAVMGNYETDEFKWHYGVAMGLDAALNELQRQYPDATVHPHNDFGATACPGKHVVEWLARRA